MDNPVDFFQPLIGQLTWLVEAGYGSFITMEFGEPHLDVWEPTTSRRAKTPRARRTLARRQVVVTGDWHFWIEHAAWKLTTAAGSLDSELPTRDGWQPVLDDLSGQRLLLVRSSQVGHLTFEFDLGASIVLSPAPGSDGDLWALRKWAGRIIACRQDGSIQIED